MVVVAPGISDGVVGRGVANGGVDHSSSSVAGCEYTFYG